MASLFSFLKLHLHRATFSWV